MVLYVFRAQLTHLDDCVGRSEPILDDELKTA
jgi:hypothetical protein